MRNNVRRVPWLLALVGLAIPLVGSGFVVWVYVLGWLVVLALVWLFGAAMVPMRSHRIVAAVVLLPVLIMLAWQGGWWLIPADLAWLAIEIADRRPRRLPGDSQRQASHHSGSSA